MCVYRYLHNSLNGKLEALFINGNSTLGTNTTAWKQRRFVIDSLTHHDSDFEARPLCEKGRFARGVKDRMAQVGPQSPEKTEWKWDSSEADAQVFGQLALQGGNGHFISCPRECSCSLPAMCRLECQNTYKGCGWETWSRSQQRIFESSFRSNHPLLFCLQKRQLLMVW